jgi:hypothetical protein
MVVVICCGTFPFERKGDTWYVWHMPSWNIHIAHVEHLLETATPEDLGLADVNCFCFGNVVPDIYVGYMVDPITKKYEYKDTHLTEAAFIPCPDASSFYVRYIQGADATPLTLGAWTHLIADHYYNLRTNDYIERIGVQPGTETRIKKQSDFDVFGRTLNVSLCPEVTELLIEQCRTFPQYRVEEEDVRRSQEVGASIIVKNEREHVSDPTYRLLTSEFFAETFQEVDDKIREALHLYHAGQDASHIGRPR